MMRKYHVRFLEGLGAATSPCLLSHLSPVSLSRDVVCHLIRQTSPFIPPSHTERISFFPGIICNKALYLGV